MIVSIILLALGAISTSLFIYGKVTNYSFKTVVIKCISSLLFISLAVYLYIYKGCPLIGLFFIIALSFGFLGDLFLGLKRPLHQYDKLLTMLGLYSFAAGHITFVSGLFTVYYVPGNIAAIIVPIGCAILGGFGALLLEKLIHIDFGKARGFAVFYFTCLTSFVFTSFSMNVLHSFSIPFLNIVLAGSISFMTSDIILSKTYFGGSNVKKRYLISTSIAYYLGQFILAFALFFL